MTEPTNEQIERLIVLKAAVEAEGWQALDPSAFVVSITKKQAEYYSALAGAHTDLLAGLQAAMTLTRTIAEAEAREAAAEHRAHIAGMREAAGMIEKRADYYRDCDQGLRVAAKWQEARDTAQAIRQRATAIETGADHEQA